MRFLLVIGVWCLAGISFAATPELPEPLARAAQRFGVETRGLSVYVQALDDDEVLLDFRADEPRQPASTMKVLSTLAALEELGPAYSWRTEAWSAATLRAGVLDGDLYLKGYGDPHLVVEHFWRLLRQLRQQGIETIRGDLVLDLGFFDPGSGDPGDFDGRASRAYNVQPSALLVNYQAVNFRFVPDPSARRVQVLAEPWPATLVLENRLRLTFRGCRGSWAGSLGLRTLRRDGREVVVLGGAYDAACGDRQLFRVVSEPLPYVHGVFQALWREMGGRFEGTVREAPVPMGARRLAMLESAPLADVIRAVNKYSNNVMTRQLLLTLGAHHGGEPGTPEKGTVAVRAWMQRRGLEFPELVFDNGSGLSRIERISARHMGQLLRIAYESPSMPEFLSSLPVSGLDGTLSRRLAATALEGRVHAKTGAIDRVRALAGYVLDARERRVIVVVFQNGRSADRGGAAAFQDAVLDWAYSRP